MYLSSSTIRNRLEVACIYFRDDVKICDCDVPAKEQTCWKLTNPGRNFWKCRNSMTRLKKCGYFGWKDEEHEEGYYKHLLNCLKQKLDSKEYISVINNLRTRIAELEFLLYKEKSMVENIKKEVFDSKKIIGRYKMVVAFLILGLVVCMYKLCK